MLGSKALVCAFLAMFIMAAISEARAVEKGLKKKALQSKRDTFIAKLRKRSETSRCISDDEEELCVEDDDCCSGACLTLNDDELAGLLFLIANSEDSSGSGSGSGSGSKERQRRDDSDEDLSDLTDEDVANLIVLAGLLNDDSDESGDRKVRRDYGDSDSDSYSGSDSDDRNARGDSDSDSYSGSDSEDRNARGDSDSDSYSGSDSEDRNARGDSSSGSDGSGNGSDSDSDERRPAKRTAFARRDVGFCIPDDDGML